MKRLLLLCGLLALAACTKEPVEPLPGGKGTAVVVGRPDGAVQGTLAVRLTAAAAERVEAARTRTGGLSAYSGLEITDEILDRIGAERFERIIPYDEIFEEQHRANGLHLWYRIYFDEGFSLEEAGKLLGADTCVSVVEYTRGYKLIKPRPATRNISQGGSSNETRALSANDPLLKYQWHYDNRGGSYLSSPKFTEMVAGADINLFNAWELCTGDPRVVVAVIDEPVQTTHPDLEANIWENTIDPANKGLHGYNFYGNSANLDWKSFDYDPTASPQNQYSYADHGTHVAGTIAAVNGNGIGVCGIAGGKNGKGGVKVMSCQIIGYGDQAKNYDANYQAFVYATDHGAVIAQNSWGFADDISESQWDASSLRKGIDYFIKNAGAKNPRFPDAPLEGGLVIFAAGNSGDVVKDVKTWPAAYGPVISVGAMDWGFRPAYYTNYGSWVDITAPGGDAYTGTTSDGANYGWNSSVVSTVLQDPTMTFKDGRDDSSKAWRFGYDAMQGTSMACPHVSGVAALGLAYAAQNGKKYTPSEFKALLLSSVYGIEDYFTGSKWYQDASGKKNDFDISAYKGKMGGGCVDALKLLLAIKGTPAIYVKTGETTKVDFARYFGGEKSSISLTSASSSSLSKIGLSAMPDFNGTTLSIAPTRVGLAFIEIEALAGDTKITREFAVVSRPSLAANGGWL